MEPQAARAKQVQETLRGLGVESRVVEFSSSTKTAQQAAEAIGCTPSQIAKSLVFCGVETGRGVLVIASGARRVDEELIGRLVGEPIRRADAQFVREITGYAIGGVPPVGHAGPLEVIVDESLFAFPEVWAAAGTPNSVFCITPAELARVAGGRVAAVH